MVNKPWSKTRRERTVQKRAATSNLQKMTMRKKVMSKTTKM